MSIVKALYRKALQFLPADSGSLPYHGLVRDCVLVQAAIGCCILLLHTSVQDGLDPLQLALVVFSCMPSSMQEKCKETHGYLLAVGITNLRGG